MLDQARAIANGVPSAGCAALVLDECGRVISSSPLAAEVLGIPAERLTLLTFEKGRGGEIAVEDGHLGQGLITLSMAEGDSISVKGTVLNVETIQGSRLILVVLTGEDGRRDLGLSRPALDLPQIAQQVRTPICSIAGYLDLLLNRQRPLRRAELNTILRVLRRNAVLVEHMMANLVAALDSGHSRPQIDIQPTSVIEVLEEAAAAAAALTEGKPRSVTLILPKRSALAMIDRAMVVRALTNLLFTAVSKTTQDARVTVGTTELAGWWQISVSDENRGAPWWRSDCAGLSGTDGPPPPAEESDLGLAITRAIVRSHGGTIGLTSSPDKGNTFWFTLPAAVSLESKGANEAQQTST